MESSKTIEDLIYDYLDREYPIEGNRVIINFAHNSFISFRGTGLDWGNPDWHYTTREERLEERKKYKTDNTISLDLVDMFGVEEQEYFWEWVEERIGEYTTIILDFTNKAVEYTDREAGDSCYNERHYATYLYTPEPQYDDDDFYEHYYDDVDEPEEEEYYERHYRNNRR